MYNENISNLSVKKFCLIIDYKKGKDKPMYGIGFFDHSMSDQEIKKSLFENSEYIKEGWLNNNIELKMKIVTAPDDWGYCPTNTEEWEDYKRSIQIH